MFYLVEAGCQQAMGITLLRGRFVANQDDEHAPVVVDVDDVFARTYFPNENPVGKRIHLETFDVTAEIVGVVGHVKQWRLDADPRSAIRHNSTTRLCSFPRSSCRLWRIPWRLCCAHKVSPPRSWATFAGRLGKSILAKWFTTFAPWIKSCPVRLRRGGCR